MNEYGSANKSDNFPVSTRTFSSLDNVWLTGEQVGTEGIGTTVQVGNYNWHSYQVIASGFVQDPVPVGVFSIETSNGTTFAEHYSEGISSTENPSGLLYSTTFLFDKARVAITGDASGPWTVIEKHASL